MILPESLGNGQGPSPPQTEALRATVRVSTVPDSRPFQGAVASASAEPMVVRVRGRDGRIASRGLVAIILLAIYHARGGLIMAEVLVRDRDPMVVEKLKARAAANGRSLQAELKAILEAQGSQVTKAEARTLAARIRRRIGSRLQTDSGMLQAEDRER